MKINLNLRTITNWSRANPITVGSMALGLAGLGVLVYALIAVSGLRGEVDSRTDKFNEVQRLGRQSITVPAEDADGQPETFRNLAISQRIVDRMRAVYDKMREQYELVFERAEAINRPGRDMLVERLFPNPGRTEDLPFTARDAYRREVQAILLPPRRGDAGVRLNAGEPPAPSELGEAIDELERDFRRKYLGTASTAAAGEGGGGDAGLELSDERQRELFELKRKLVRNRILERAQSVHVYAESNPASPSFPFTTRSELINATSAPPPSLLWEAQLELWIMQDIAQAVARANGVGNEDMNVALAPVKRLLEVTVLPGYVGIHTKGALGDGSFRSGGGSVAVNRGRVYSPPSHDVPDDPDRRLPSAFHYSPTGRVSNALYDVRHARVRIVADFSRLPEFVDALTHVNFMTVIRMDVTDINEFEALQRGYFYGPGDCVEVDMIVESIWMRSWTTPLMPPSVMRYLGASAPAPTEEGEADEARSPRFR